MTVADFAFYIIAVSTVTGGVFTVVSKDPVQSVIWLVLTFSSAAGLFILLGAEFVAVLMIVVYVGAVAVMFIGVVRIIDVDFNLSKHKPLKHFRLALLIGVILLFELALVLGVWYMSQNAEISVRPEMNDVQNNSATGSIIYDNYAYLIYACGLILLVAGVGSIVLTRRRHAGGNRQNVAAQMHRDPAGTKGIINLKQGQGL